MVQADENKKTAIIRLYGSLNDFIPHNLRQRSLICYFKGNPNIKDTIESVGVPHPEIQLILFNGEPVTFNKPMEQDARISVYPFFHNIDVSYVQLVNPKPYDELKFMLDVHLGKLAKYLRFAGFDCLLIPFLDDHGIVSEGTRDNRIILSRDIGLLKHKRVKYGYWLRSQMPEEQFKEVVQHFRIKEQDLNPCQRCTTCNGKIKSIEKYDIIEDLKPGTKKYFDEFFQCQNCGRIYWKGSHYKRMRQWLEKTIISVYGK